MWKVIFIIKWVLSIFYFVLHSFLLRETTWCSLFVAICLRNKKQHQSIFYVCILLLNGMFKKKNNKKKHQSAQRQWCHIAQYWPLASPPRVLWQVSTGVMTAQVRLTQVGWKEVNLGLVLSSLYTIISSKAQGCIFLKIHALWLFCKLHLSCDYFNISVRLIQGLYNFLDSQYKCDLKVTLYRYYVPQDMYHHNTVMLMLEPNIFFNYSLNILFFAFQINIQ